MAPTEGERKAGMDISHKGIWGYHPLIVSLANTKEVLYLLNRPGNASSHTDSVPYTDQAINMVAPHSAWIRVRGDTDRTGA